MERFTAKAGFAATAGGAVMLLSTAGACAQAVDTNSTAYKSGYIVGQVLVVVIVILVIRKIFFSGK